MSTVMPRKQGRMEGRDSRKVWKNKIHTVSSSNSRMTVRWSRKPPLPLSQRTESSTVPLLLSLANAAHRWFIVCG